MISFGPTTEQSDARSERLWKQRGKIAAISLIEASAFALGDLGLDAQPASEVHALVVIESLTFWCGSTRTPSSSKWTGLSATPPIQTPLKLRHIRTIRDFKAKPSNKRSFTTPQRSRLSCFALVAPTWRRLNELTRKQKMRPRVLKIPRTAPKFRLVRHPKRLLML